MGLPLRIAWSVFGSSGMDKKMSEKTEFYEPLIWLYVSFENGEMKYTSEEWDDVYEMIERWKEEHLNDRIKKTYDLMKNPPKKRNIIIRVLLLIKLLITYLWPIFLLIALSVVLPTLTVVFIAMLLLPVQLLILIIIFSKIWNIACVYAVVALERRGFDADI